MDQLAASLLSLFSALSHCCRGGLREAQHCLASVRATTVATRSAARPWTARLAQACSDRRLSASLPINRDSSVGVLCWGFFPTLWVAAAMLAETTVRIIVKCKMERRLTGANHWGTP